MALSGSVSTNPVREGRYYTLSWTATQSVENNRSTISWTLSCAGGVSWYAERTLKVVVAGSTVVDKTDRVERYAGTIATGTGIVNHASDGSAAFEVSIRAAVYTTTVNSTASQTFVLDVIPRKSELTVADGTLGVAQTLSVTRKSTSFTHTITASCGTATSTICTKSTNTSISFTPPLAWASQNTTGVTVPVTYTITTYNGTTSIGSASRSKVCKIPDSVAPSCKISVSDAAGYSSTYGGYLQGLSKAKITVTPTASYGSEITSYYTSLDGSIYTESTFTTAALRSTGMVSIISQVTDARGRSGQSLSSITVLEYTAPVIRKLSTSRCNSDGTANDSGEYIKVTFSYVVSSLNSKNSVTCSIKYKKKTATAYTTANQTGLSTTYTATGKTYIFAASSGSSYDVVLTVGDKFNTTTKSTSVSTGTTIMHWLASGLGMAIGKVAELSNVFEVAWYSRFRNHVCIGEKNNSTDGKAGIYMDKSGYMLLQRSGASPYIGFLLDSATSALSASIELNNTKKKLLFKSASAYEFDNDAVFHDVIVPRGGSTLRPTTANRTPTGSGGLYSFKASSSMTTAKTPWDSHILGFEWDATNGFDSQLALRNRTGELAVRGQIEGTWGDWSRIPRSFAQGVCMRSDTLVINPNGATTGALFTNAVINGWFGVTNVSNLNTVVFASNGDYIANNACVIGAVYSSTKTRWEFVLNKATSNNIRINYLVVYWGVV